MTKFYDHLLVLIWVCIMYCVCALKG